MNAAVSQPSLSALVSLLAEQALLAMGVPHPMMPTQPPANPSIARFYLDLIVVLKEKTEGNRSDSETRELDDMIYNLRMKILNLSSPGLASSPEGAGVRK
ncbi:MAG: DUF1844 domain-containing protein [Holophaga sp.]|nr:DUF1844 domain-containing protein [Holophaga sp.]